MSGVQAAAMLFALDEEGYGTDEPAHRSLLMESRMALAPWRRRRRRQRRRQREAEEQGRKTSSNSGSKSGDASETVFQGQVMTFRLQLRRPPGTDLETALAFFANLRLTMQLWGKELPDANGDARTVELNRLVTSVEVVAQNTPDARPQTAEVKARGEDDDDDDDDEAETT